MLLFRISFLFLYDCWMAAMISVYTCSFCWMENITPLDAYGSIHMDSTMSKIQLYHGFITEYNTISPVVQRCYYYPSSAVWACSKDFQILTLYDIGLGKNIVTQTTEIPAPLNLFVSTSMSYIWYNNTPSHISKTKRCYFFKMGVFSFQDMFNEVRKHHFGTKHGIFKKPKSSLINKLHWWLSWNLFPSSSHKIMLSDNVFLQ